MELQDNDGSPNIVWDIDDRYAIIAFLLMSVDKKPDTMSMKKLDTFMGIAPVEKGSDTEENDKLQAVRNAVVRECGVFLDSLDRNDSYCDSLMDEIDCIIDGDDNCGIGGGHSVGLLDDEPIKLPGGVHFLFDYIGLILNEGSYSENQKRILRHLARKWKINTSALPVLESSVKSLNEINEKRTGISDSDMPYREAVPALSDLEKEEQAVWGKLKEFGITNERAIDAENYNIGKNFAKALFPFHPLLKDKNDCKDEDDEEDAKEYTLSDKIGDTIVDGIMKVGDLICAPFEWMTEKIIHGM
ncbi:MAG: hypothetical protein LBH44_01910 [Treponema sp.]|jgi:hypothetical protein|nr:hypothetical protein [Treponema sp.]